ncbi:MAG: hypothetical protein K2K46_03390 [Lachnospiraceae bacterium]|nr:hypothetical protein [Lachnospiraceae bacterium]
MAIIKQVEFLPHRFLLKELDKGFEIMWDKKEDYGKVMGMVLSFCQFLEM